MQLRNGQNSGKSLFTASNISGLKFGFLSRSSGNLENFEPGHLRGSLTSAFKSSTHDIYK